MALQEMLDLGQDLRWRFGFKATKNVAEYETLLVGFWLVKEMQVKRLFISWDSQLAISQVNGSFSSKDKGMAAYLKLVIEFVPTLERFELIQIPCCENPYADTLSKLESSRDFEL